MLVIINSLLYGVIGFVHTPMNKMLSARRRNGVKKWLAVTVEDQELSKGIESINNSNRELMEMLMEMVENPFFRLYSVDMLASCEYLPQITEECYTESCEIYPVEEEEVPSGMRSIDMEEHDFALDGWARWDMPTEDYYDINMFPETYTGYDGSSIWRFIHETICFADVDEEEEEWKADFNKVVSGIHSMISAAVVSGIEKKIASGEDMSEDIWTDPVAEFKRRLSPTGENKHAMQNLYFTYMLILTAVRQARGRLLRDCASGKIDASSAILLQRILDYKLLEDPSISIASSKLHDHAVKDLDSINALWQARMRTRELMRITNCAQCSKCKLHGKISVLGISTALQILLGSTGEGGDPTRIHRVEIAALMTVLSKFSKAVQYCNKMSHQL